MTNQKAITLFALGLISFADYSTAIKLQQDVSKDVKTSINETEVATEPKEIEKKEDSHIITKTATIDVMEPAGIENNTSEEVGTDILDKKLVMKTFEVNGVEFKQFEDKDAEGNTFLYTELTYKDQDGQKKGGFLSNMEGDLIDEKGNVLLTLDALAMKHSNPEELNEFTDELFSSED